MRDKYNRIPLHTACWCGHKEVVQYLMEESECDVGEPFTEQTVMTIVNVVKRVSSDQICCHTTHSREGQVQQNSSPLCLLVWTPGSCSVSSGGN